MAEKNEKVKVEENEYESSELFKAALERLLNTPVEITHNDIGGGLKMMTIKKINRKTEEKEDTTKQ